MKKLIVNHIDKVFRTSDVSTILNEINVHHPAANLVKMAVLTQKEDFGDSTNFLIVLIGELINGAEELLNKGIDRNDIIEGYRAALAMTTKILNGSVYCNITSLNDEHIPYVILSAIASKLPNHYKHFALLVIDGC